VCRAHLWVSFSVWLGWVGFGGTRREETDFPRGLAVLVQGRVERGWQRGGRASRRECGPERGVH
jgi:hypothetical protein